MRPPAIVEVEVAADRGAGPGYAIIGPQVHPLVLNATPPPLDKDLVALSAFAVHANGDGVALKHAGEGRPSELAALVVRTEKKTLNLRVAGGLTDLLCQAI